MNTQKHIRSTTIFLNLVVFVIAFSLIHGSAAYATNYSGNYNSTVVIAANDTAVDTGNVSISTNHVDGMRLGQGSTVNFGNFTTTIRVSGTTSLMHGIRILGDNATITGMRGSIVTNPDRSHGINVSESYANANLAFSGTIQTNGRTSYGVYVGGATNKLTLTGSIDTYKAHGYGIYANEGGTVEMIGNITTHGTTDSLGNYISAYGIYATNSAHVLMTGDIATYGFESCGISAFGGARVDLSGDITTRGELAHGVLVNSYTTPGVVTIHSGDVTTEGNRAKGLYTQAGGRIYASNDIVISTSGDNADGIMSEGASYSTGAASYINAAGSVITLGKEAHGVAATQGGQVEFTGSVHTKNESASGLFAGNGGRLVIVDTDVVTEGVGAHGIYSTGSKTTGTSTDHSIVSMSGGTLAVADDPGTWYLAVDGGGKIDLQNMTVGNGSNLNLLKTTSSGDLSADNVVLIGDITHTGESDDILSAALANSSVLTGSVNALDSGSGRIDVALGNSVWNVTGDSMTAGKLSMTGDSALDYSSAPLGTKVTIKDLEGSGAFMMKADVAAETSDRLSVFGTSQGDHSLTVQNSGSESVTGKERIILVETADTGSAFSLTHEVEIGAWKYVLSMDNDGRGQFDGAGGQYWELRADGGSNPGEGAIDTFIGNYFLNYAETETLAKRLGDLRGDRQYGRHGAWFRGFGGKFDSDQRHYAGGFDMDYWGVQVGYDYLLDRERSWFKNGDTYAGAFIGYSEGDMDFDQMSYGKGDLEHRTMGMYWTYIGDAGYYFDAVAKYVWSKNDFNVRDSANDLVQGGRINTGGAGLSFETGKRFRFDKVGAGAWYVEPQAQLSWQHFGGAMFHATNGLRIGVEGYDSLIGRLGVIVGYESAGTNIYGKVSYLREFDGDMHVNANDVILFESLDDSWWVYGIGITHQLNQRNALYLDLERASGGDFTQKWNINAGWRISF